MKAYSMDLRIRVIEAYKQGKGSMQELAKVFSIHWRTAQNWINRFEKEKTVGPKIYKRGPEPKIKDEQLPRIQELIVSNNAMSQDELKEQIKKELDIEVSLSTVGRAMGRLEMTKKKDIFSK